MSQNQSLDGLGYDEPLLSLVAY
jgi:hypothetical protein